MKSSEKKVSFPPSAENPPDLLEQRHLEHGINKFETLMNLLKSIIGTGIYSIPLAFSYTGFVTGIFSLILTSTICAHCVVLLLKCNHKLCRKLGVPSLTYPEVARFACLNGPDFMKPWSKFSEHTVSFMIALTCFGICSVYTVIIAESFEQIIRYYFKVDTDIRIYLLFTFIPCLLLAWIPHLKYLAPFSALANVAVLVGLLITFIYCFKEMPASLSDRPLHTSIWSIPSFFGIVIFAMEAIGIILPIENQMRHPHQMMGFKGVISIAMTFVTILYGITGLIGYARYGDKVSGSITLNLPVDEIPAQAVKIMIALAVYISVGLQFYVTLEILWNSLKNRFTNNVLLINYIVRTLLMMTIILVAIAVPNIGAFLSLVGSFCISISGLLIPVFIETLTYWFDGFGKYHWIICKNIIIVIFGFIALILGTKSAIGDIIDMYQVKEIHKMPLKGREYWQDEV